MGLTRTTSTRSSLFGYPVGLLRHLWNCHALRGVRTVINLTFERVLNAGKAEMSCTAWPRRVPGVLGIFGARCTFALHYDQTV